LNSGRSFPAPSGRGCRINWIAGSTKSEHRTNRWIKLSPGVAHAACSSSRTEVYAVSKSLCWRSGRSLFSRQLILRASSIRRLVSVTPRGFVGGLIWQPTGCADRNCGRLAACRYGSRSWPAHGVRHLRQDRCRCHRADLHGRVSSRLAADRAWWHGRSATRARTRAQRPGTLTGATVPPGGRPWCCVQPVNHCQRRQSPVLRRRGLPGPH